MPVLTTALRHFQEDLARARSLVDHARGLDPSTLREDILRSAWMFGVGALDAFFCDAYGDLVARTLQAKQLDSGVSIPEKMLRVSVPAITVISNVRSDNWRWRMAARAIIENQSVLSFDEVKKLFNQFFRTDEKLFAKSRIARWIVHRDARIRMFGISPTQFRALQGANRNRACEKAWEHLKKRFEGIFQRRHDCIHNCDRPKVALNRDSLGSTLSVEKILVDIEFLVSRCADEIQSEFREYLQRLGFSAVTRNRVEQ
jgi:hypothetical protein